MHISLTAGDEAQEVERDECNFVVLCSKIDSQNE